MTTKHDYKAALVDFNSAQIDTEMPRQALVLVSYDTIHAIEHALKIADALSGIMPFEMVTGSTCGRTNPNSLQMTASMETWLVSQPIKAQHVARTILEKLEGVE